MSRRSLLELGSARGKGENERRKRGEGPCLPLPLLSPDGTGGEKWRGKGKKEEGGVFSFPSFPSLLPRNGGKTKKGKKQDSPEDFSFSFVPRKGPEKREGIIPSLFSSEPERRSSSLSLPPFYGKRKENFVGVSQKG